MRGDFVFVAHLFCDGGCHDDGHGVVCCGDVQGTYQEAYAELPASVTLEYFMDKVEQCCKSAMDADKSAEGAHEDCDHDGFVHPGNTIADMPKEPDEIELPACDHDDGCRDDAHE